jgi:hypothetical protein
MRGTFFAFLLLLGSPFCRGEAGCDSWLNVTGASLENGERTELTCKWAEPCQTIFSYELNDKNRDDHIDIKVTDGGNCGFFGDIKYYDQHYVNDISYYAVYDQKIKDQVANNFCITFTCDNRVQGCDKLDINAKMSCVQTERQGAVSPQPTETQQTIINTTAEKPTNVTKRFTNTKCIDFLVTSDQDMQLVIVVEYTEYTKFLMGYNYKYEEKCENTRSCGKIVGGLNTAKQYYLVVIKFGETEVVANKCRTLPQPTSDSTSKAEVVKGVTFLVSVIAMSMFT